MLQKYRVMLTIINSYSRIDCFTISRGIAIDPPLIYIVITERNLKRKSSVVYKITVQQTRDKLICQTAMAMKLLFLVYFFSEIKLQMP